MTTVIPSTRLIRKSSPIVCRKGDQGAHIVGLNLAKKIFNYYSKERNIVIDQDVIDQLIIDINDKDNFACETVEENTEDKYTEADVLDMLMEGRIHYKDLSIKARTMFNKLRILLYDMIEHLNHNNKNDSAKVINMILDELNDEDSFPLPRYCLTCRNKAIVKENELNGRVFCDVICQTGYEYQTDDIGVILDLLSSMSITTFVTQS